MIECKHIETTEKKIEIFKPDDESDMMKVIKNITRKQKKNSENSDGKIEQMTFQCVLLMPSHSDMKDSWTLAGPLNWSRSGAHCLLGTNCFRAENYFFFFYVLTKNAPGNESVIFHLQNFFLNGKVSYINWSFNVLCNCKITASSPWKNWLSVNSWDISISTKKVRYYDCSDW